MFRKKKTVDKTDKDLIKKAKKYKKILENADKLPENSMEMYQIIKKAGLR